MSKKKKDIKKVNSVKIGHNYNSKEELSDLDYLAAKIKGFEPKNENELDKLAKKLLVNKENDNNDDLDELAKKILKESERNEKIEEDDKKYEELIIEDSEEDSEYFEDDNEEIDSDIKNDDDEKDEEDSEEIIENDVIDDSEEDSEDEISENVNIDELDYVDNKEDDKEDDEVENDVVYDEDDEDDDVNNEEFLNNDSSNDSSNDSVNYELNGMVIIEGTNSTSNYFENIIEEDKEEIIENDVIDDVIDNMNTVESIEKENIIDSEENVENVGNKDNEIKDKDKDFIVDSYVYKSTTKIDKTTYEMFEKTNKMNTRRKFIKLEQLNKFLIQIPKYLKNYEYLMESTSSPFNIYFNDKLLLDFYGNSFTIEFTLDGLIYDKKIYSYEKLKFEKI